MILQINLLPEARIEKLQAIARKRTIKTAIILTSIVVATVCVTLLLLIGYTFSLNQAGKARVEDLKKDIALSASMEKKAATLQDNLASFASLQQSRLYVSEIFSSLSNVVPAGVQITNFEISDDYKVTITGSATSFAAVSTFSKGLQEYNVNFKPQANLERKPLFTDVQITSVSKDTGAGSSSVNFSMTFQVDPTLFNQTTGQ